MIYKTRYAKLGEKLYEEVTAYMDDTLKDIVYITNKIPSKSKIITKDEYDKLLLAKEVNEQKMIDIAEEEAESFRTELSKKREVILNRFASLGMSTELVNDFAKLLGWSEKI